MHWILSGSEHRVRSRNSEKMKNSILERVNKTNKVLQSKDVDKHVRNFLEFLRTYLQI